MGGAVVFAVTLLLLHAVRGFRATGVAAAADLCAFVAIRAISLHAVDQALFAATTLGVQRSALVELGVVGMLVASALLDTAFARRGRPALFNWASESRIGGGGAPSV